MAQKYFVCIIFVLFVANRGAVGMWSMFSPANFSTSVREFASQRLTALRSLRDNLYDSMSSNATGNANKSTAIKLSNREDSLGNIFKNFNSFLSIMKPLKKMIYSRKGIERLASVMSSKREILQRLLEIKGDLEPTVRQYMTGKYNGFLTSLIPYSENIGVPPFVINSMKIPQDLDPRWQLIKSILKTQGGMENFLRSLLNGEAHVKLPEGVESRSIDETELISDQEPDAMGQGYRKNLYLSSFKRRLMKPGPGNRFKLVSGARPYQQQSFENAVDQTGQYGSMAYEVRAPDDLYSDDNAASGTAQGYSDADIMDMVMSASGHGGRGHGYGGHGHSQPSYGGFLDPFTILGGLAFLTYLGLMLQNSLNRNMTGRSLPWESRIPVIPISLKAPAIAKTNPAVGSWVKTRQGKSLSPPTTPITIDVVLKDLSLLWKELEELKIYSASHPNDNCIRFQLCRVVMKLKETNLEPIFTNKLLESTVDEKFVNTLFQTSELSKICSAYGLKSCAFT